MVRFLKIEKCCACFFITMSERILQITHVSNDDGWNVLPEMLFDPRGSISEAPAEVGTQVPSTALSHPRISRQ